MARYTGATCRLCRREGQKLLINVLSLEEAMHQDNMEQLRKRCLTTEFN